MTRCMFIGAHYIDTAGMTHIKTIRLRAGLIGPLQSRWGTKNCEISINLRQRKHAVYRPGYEHWNACSTYIC
jgi:hypothetical protein